MEKNKKKFGDIQALYRYRLSDSYTTTDQITTDQTRERLDENKRLTGRAQ
jgi:hypothetical protein